MSTMYDGTAEEAANFYVRLLPDSRIEVVNRSPIDTEGREFDSRSRCEWAASKPLCPSRVSASWPSRTCYQMP
jgi:3-demethylubiquinone-9 3-methyltransferase